MRLTGGGDAARTDIRLLWPRTATETAVAGRNAVLQVVPANLSPIIRTESSREAVQMVVKQELSNTGAGAVPNPPVSTSVAQQITAAAQAIQPKIDINRLTDEVYRMLERRLIAERERRGR